MMPEAIIDAALGGKRIGALPAASRLHENRSIIFHRDNVTAAERAAVKENRGEISGPGISGGFQPEGNRAGGGIEIRISRNSNLSEYQVETHQPVAAGIGGNPGRALIGSG